MKQSIRAGARKVLGKVPNGITLMKFKEVHEEFKIFRDLIKDKVSPVSLKRLVNMISELENIALCREGRCLEWSTTVGGPLETVANGGCHQVARRGHGRNLKGVVDFKWEIEPCGQASKKFPLSRMFALHNSSVIIKIHDVKECVSVASWAFDVGDHQSPGCHLHAKLSPVDEAEERRLRDVDVPRLPGLLFMPTDALDFVLGELWQEEWPQIVSRRTREVLDWKKFPTQRLKNVLRWYLEQVENASGAPWAGLKLAKPGRFMLGAVNDC